MELLTCLREAAQGMAALIVKRKSAGFKTVFDGDEQEQQQRYVSFYRTFYDKLDNKEINLDEFIYACYLNDQYKFIGCAISGNEVTIDVQQQEKSDLKGWLRKL